MESGCFGVEVFELRSELRGAPPLLLERLVVGDSTAVSGAAALHGDRLAAAGSLLCQ